VYSDGAGAIGTVGYPGPGTTVSIVVDLLALFVVVSRTVCVDVIRTGTVVVVSFFVTVVL
jgi:hypothetical protein